METNRSKGHQYSNRAVKPSFLLSSIKMFRSICYTKPALFATSLYICSYIYVTIDETSSSQVSFNAELLMYDRVSEYLLIKYQN